ncbi:MAG: peptidoglycan DD-metalloendopeptidase family protein [Clostridia bacterium]|nr:peptidoglycan DD-metalloendopeptidase family protein [Clostridia bacterium]
MLAISAVSLTIAASGVTFGYTVRYSNEVIAVVSSEAQYDKADAIVLSSMDKESASKAAISPKFGITLTVKNRLNTTEEIVDAIVDNNDEIVAATGIIVNDKVAFCVEGEKVNELIDARLKAYFVEGADNKSEFADNVKVERGYFLKSDMVDLETAKAYIDDLSVKTVSVVTSQVEIPYETKNIKTSEKPRGYSLITTKGENGITEKTEEIVKINGEVSSTTELSSKVIKEQVTRVVTVGTGVNYVSATTKANVASAGFICPISAGKYKVSAYYGDGRNHKGIDLAANRGTPIFAVQAGKVTYAGWDSDYGYNVVIEHLNGLKTRYAHANALCVSKGATVAQGDMIATVGSTGWSTGNHLHFEVIVNGVRVNPGPYIGLR